eukprot:911748-Amphidinium_carterae.1
MGKNGKYGAKLDGSFTTRVAFQKVAIVQHFALPIGCSRTLVQECWPWLDGMRQRYLTLWLDMRKRQNLPMVEVVLEKGAEKSRKPPILKVIHLK